MRIATVLAGLAIAAPLAAQGRGRNTNNVPPGQRPPAGMCRIWIDGVPPGQQPAPTDCATANARRPANSRIIYGDDTRNTRNTRNTRTNRSGVYVPGQTYPNGGVYVPGQSYPNGGVPGQTYPNGGVYPNGNSYPNGASYPNGQNCYQQVDRNGQVRTLCRDRGDDDEDDDRRAGANNRREDDREFQNGARGNGHGKHKGKHKGHGDNDRDD